MTDKEKTYTNDTGRAAFLQTEKVERGVGDVSVCVRTRVHVCDGGTAQE